MDKKVFIYIILTILFISQGLYAENIGYYRPLADNVFEDYFQNRTLFIPAGITTDAVLSQEINSKTAIVGQNINAILTNDFKYQDLLIAPSGSIVSGNIVYNRKAGYAGKDAQIQIRFTTIRTPYNNIIPVNAVIATNNSAGIIKGNTFKSGSLGHVKDDKDTVGSFTTFKGGLGAVQTVSEKGNHILIPSNSRISLVFDQPITLGAR